jgi:hypothetical protein
MHAKVGCMRAQVMDQCRDVYATRQRTLADEPSTTLPQRPGGKAQPPGAKDSWSAFRVALLAAKRKPKPPSGRI